MCIGSGKVNDFAVFINIRSYINDRIGMCFFLQRKKAIFFAGEISVCDVILSKTTERPIRDNVGFLFGIPDDQILFPNVLDDISFTLERRGIPREEARQRVLPIMKSLGIETVVYRLGQLKLKRVAICKYIAGCMLFPLMTIR